MFPAAFCYACVPTTPWSKPSYDPSAKISIRLTKMNVSWGLSGTNPCFLTKREGDVAVLRRFWTVDKKQRTGIVAEIGARKDESFSRAKVAVFLSGGGSNFRALHEAMQANTIYGDIVLVVSDKPECKGCEYARQQSIPVLTFPITKNTLHGLTAKDTVQALRTAEVEYILLAGFLKIIPVELVQAYPRAILNIHPSLLPAFGGKGYYGMKVHQAVIKSGARFSGPTVHFVDENFDTGPILCQRVVPVLVDDTPQQLAERVLGEEHSLFVEAAAALCEDRIFWREDGVPLIRRSWDEAEYY